MERFSLRTAQLVKLGASEREQLLSVIEMGRCQALFATRRKEELVALASYPSQTHPTFWKVSELPRAIQ